ncbi:hypothetical protein SNEBB_010843 [Seison nebaliae]|nr:hypothetical protein SNEBB_010843 [Seison nebaliae]
MSQPHFRVGIKASPPFTKKEIVNGTVKFSGFSVDVFERICHFLNATHEFFEPPDNTYGSYDFSTHTSSGMASMIYSNTIDLAIGPWSITLDRQAILRFTSPYMEEAAGIMTKRQKFGVDEGYYKIFRPFELNLWITCFTTIVVVGLVLYLFLVYENKYVVPQLKTQRKPFREISSAKFRRCMAFSFGKFFKQNVELEPNSFPARMIVGSWWFVTLIIMASYTANLTANLTVKQSSKLIDSLNDLIKAQGYHIGIRNGSNLHNLFMTSKIPKYKKIKEKIVKDEEASLFYTNNEAFNTSLSRENYAIIMDYSQLKFMTNQNCDLILANERFDPVNLAFAVNNNFEYIDQFNKLIIKMQETGIIERLKDRYWSENKCDEKYVSDNTETVMTIEQLKGAFVGLVAGAAVSFVILIIELFYDYFLRKKALKSTNKRTITSGSTAIPISVITNHSEK